MARRHVDAMAWRLNPVATSWSHDSNEVSVASAATVWRRVARESPFSSA